MVSHPALWCSPIQASSKPRWSSHCTSSRSRSNASVGFSPTRWKGPMKIPNFIRSGKGMTLNTPICSFCVAAIIALNPNHANEEPSVSGGSQCYVSILDQTLAGLVRPRLSLRLWTGLSNPSGEMHILLLLAGGDKDSQQPEGPSNLHEPTELVSVWTPGRQ